MATVEIIVGVHPVRSKHHPYPFYGKVEISGITVYECTVAGSNLKEAQENMTRIFAECMSIALRDR